MAKGFSFSVKMRSATRGFALLFVTAFAVLTNNAAAQEKRQIYIAEAIPIKVNYLANVSVPIHFTSLDYTGPYDPADPKGTGAANRRHLKMMGQKHSEMIKSYIPPGLDKLAKKEVIHLAVSEGKRFAVMHPKETAELLGIVTRVKGLVHNANKKIKDAEEKELKEKEKRQKH